MKEDILTDEGKIICELTNIFTNKSKEIERLNNIINELEKFIINNLDYWNKESSQRSSYISEALTKTLDKLKELKGGND